MATRFDGDWDYWRRRFVSGGDEVSLRWLSEQPGAPSYSSLRKRSAPKWEDWEEQRRNYRKNKGTLASIAPDAKEAVQAAARLVDTAEMLSRHIRAARLIGQKAIQAMQATDPATLKPSEALAWMKFAIEAERLTEGLATQRQEIDLSGLSDAELERMANGG
jgi:hypothetical protein